MTDKDKPNTGSLVAPHVCDCGSACYRGFLDIKCVNILCQWHDRETLDAFCTEHLVGVRDEANDLFDDEDTQPGAAFFKFDLPTAPSTVEAWAKVLGVSKVLGETEDQLRARLLKRLGRAPGMIVEFDDDDTLPDSYMVPVVKGFD